MRSNKKITKVLVSLFAITMIIFAQGCSNSADKDPDYNVVSDLKNMTWDDFGSQKFEDAANESMTKLHWTYSDSPVDYDGGIVYEAVLEGYSEEYDLSISVGFKVTYEYGKMANDPQNVIAEIEWVQVGDEYSELTEDIVYVMDYIYGNLSD